MDRRKLALKIAASGVIISALCFVLIIAQSTRYEAVMPVYLEEPHVGQVLKNIRLDTDGFSSEASVIGQPPLVSRASLSLARQTLLGTRLNKVDHSNLKSARTQQLRFTGRFGDTSYVINAPHGDPATVIAHNSIWPSKVNSKMPYVETVHGDGTPYMQPLTVYAPPGGTVVTTILPGTSARPPIPTRYAFLPEADNAPLDNTAYKCAPSGYMVGPIGYHCTPACKDSALWRSDYGDCSLYRDTGVTSSGFKDYCGVDKDIAGVPAAVACPVSCGTCGIGLCYENSMFKKCKLSTYSSEGDDDVVS